MERETMPDEHSPVRHILVLRRIDPESGDRTIAELDRRFERQPDDPPEHRFREA